MKELDLNTEVINMEVSQRVFPMSNIRTTIFCKKSIFDNENTLPEDVKEKISELNEIIDESSNKSKIDKIIEILESDKNSDNKYNELKSLGISEEEMKGLGCLIGMAIGDTLGSKYEFQPVNKDFYNADNYNSLWNEELSKSENKINDNNITWTDDTSMGICLLDSLIVNNGELNEKDLKNRFLLWWSHGYNNGSENFLSDGLGGQIRQSLNDYLNNYCKIFATKHSDHDSGNGSIMRNAAIPLINIGNSKYKKLIAYTKLQSKTTHSGGEAADCCILLSLLCSDFINYTFNLNLYLNHIENNINRFSVHFSTKTIIGLIKSQEKCHSMTDKDSKGNPKIENWNWKNKNFSYNNERANNSPTYIGSYAMDAMAMALHILYYTDSFEHAIRTACRLQGDADSVGSVVGQLAGAYYGIHTIPSSWIKKIFSLQGGKDLIKKGLILMRINKN